MRDPTTLIAWRVACGVCGVNSANLGLGAINILMFFVATALACAERPRATAGMSGEIRGTSAEHDALGRGISAEWRAGAAPGFTPGDRTMNDRKTEIALRDKTHLLPDIAVQPPEEARGYEAALFAAGVKVLDFEQFGDYQGTWWAHVALPNGELGFVEGSYGSCSGCDAFEAEFGWSDESKPDYLHRIRDFGRGYLSNVMDPDAAVAEASRNIEWDRDAQPMVDWLKARAAGDKNAAC